MAQNAHTFHVRSSICLQLGQGFLRIVWQYGHTCQSLRVGLLHPGQNGRSSISCNNASDSRDLSYASDSVSLGRKIRYMMNPAIGSVAATIAANNCANRSLDLALMSRKVHTTRASQRAPAKAPNRATLQRTYVVREVKSISVGIHKSVFCSHYSIRIIAVKHIDMKA